MTLSLLPLRYGISTCLTEITWVYQIEVTCSCPSLHIKESRGVTVGDNCLFFLLCISLPLSVSEWALSFDRNTHFWLGSADREIPRFSQVQLAPGGISPAMPVDWLNASLSFFSFSLSWISLAHSPCWECRAQREMEEEQDGKILCQPV